MALFVHLTPEKNVRGIVRSGIKKGTRGVFCLPVLPSYVVSHQWLRELRRGGQRTFVAVDFRIPDDEPVSVGHYGRPTQSITAAQAIGLVRDQHDPRGYEVIVPRGIARGELHRARHVNQVSGWRYAPNQHGVRPCACAVCLPTGAFKAADIRARYGDPPLPTKPELMAQLAAATSPHEISDVLWSLGSRSRGDAGDLAYLTAHPVAEVRADLATALAAYRIGRPSNCCGSWSATRMRTYARRLRRASPPETFTRGTKKPSCQAKKPPVDGFCGQPQRAKKPR